MAQQQIVVMPNGGEWEFDQWDMQYHCLHVNVEIEDNSFDYAGTHATNGQSGTHVQHNAICQDCDEDVSETYDWESHFDRGDDDYDRDNDR